MAKDSRNKSESSAPLTTYIVANVLFWGFLVALYLVAAIIIKDASGMMFVLGALGLAFTVVSIGDWLFERHDARAADAEKAAETESAPVGK